MSLLLLFQPFSLSPELSYTQEANAAFRRISYGLLIDWDLDGDFTVETPNVLSLQIEKSINEPLGGISLSIADAVLSNVTDRYTPR